MNLTYERSIFSIYLPNYLRMGFSAWTLLTFGAGSFFCSEACSLHFSIYLPNYLRMGFSAWTLLMFGAGSFFVVRPVLCTVGCLAASLASTEEMPVTPSTHALVTTTNVSGLCQCPLGGKIVQLTTIAQKYSFPTKTT